MLKFLLVSPLMFLWLISVQAQDFYVVQPPDVDNTDLQVINPFEGTISEVIQVSLDNAAVSGYTALAYNPANNQLYAVTKAGPAFELITLDPNEGTSTLVGTLPNKMAALAFSPEGDCYALSGDGGNPGSTLYEINPATAEGTLLLELTSDGDGEAMAFNSTDGNLYRFGGGGQFQRIDPETLTIDELGTAFPTYAFGQAMYYRAAEDDFLIVIGWEAFELETDGAQTFISSFPIGLTIKGMVATSDLLAISTQTPKSGTHIQAFPNPSSNWVQLDFGDTVSNLQLDLFDLNGTLLQSVQLEQVREYQLDLSALAAGTYQLRIRQDDQLFVKQLVKQ